MDRDDYNGQDPDPSFCMTMMDMVPDMDDIAPDTGQAAAEDKPPTIYHVRNFRF